MTKASIAAERKAAAIAQAESDAALLEELQKKAAEDAEIEESETEGTEDPVQRDPTIADRFLGMSELVVTVRKRLLNERTPLSEASLVKLMELAISYHAWDYSRTSQERQYSNFAKDNGSVSEDDLVGPEPDEVIGEVIDFPTPTPTTETE